MMRGPAVAMSNFVPQQAGLIYNALSIKNDGALHI